MHQFAHVGLAEVVFLASGLDTGEVENVVDERGQPFALFADDAVVLLIFFRAGEPPHLQRLGVEADQRKRRAQLVRNVGNEIGLQPGQRHFLGDVAIGQHNSARQHQRQSRQSQEADMREALADGCQRGSAQLDRQRQSREGAFQVSLRFRRAAIPPAGLSQRRRFILAAQHHDRMIPVGLSVADVASNHVVQHLGKELVAQIVGVERHAADRRVTRSSGPS